MRDRVPADLDSRLRQVAKLVRSHDPSPWCRRVRLSEPARDDEDRRRRTELAEQRRDRLEVVDETIVESDRSVPSATGALDLSGEIAERDEPVPPLPKARDLPAEILRAHEEPIRVAAERNVRNPVVDEGKRRRQALGHTEIVR